MIEDEEDVVEAAEDVDEREEERLEDEDELMEMSPDEPRRTRYPLVVMNHDIMNS